MEYDLVFEGGGAKGTVFVGAMQAFEERGHTIGRLLGTSAGAITATLLAAGYNSQDLYAVNQEKQDGESVFTSFMGTPESFSAETVQNSLLNELFQSIDIPLLSDKMERKFDEWLGNTLIKSEKYRHLFSFIEQGGWYAADAFVTWIQRKLDEGSFDGKPRHFSHLTLKEFHAATQRDLTLIAADTTSRQMLVLNHRTAPDCPVVWAVRMSMSIPLVWQEVTWKKEWGNYRGKELSANAIVDGGLLSNFPIALFISTDPITTSVMGERNRNNRILGMMIDENSPVPGLPDEPEEEEPSSFSNTINRLVRIVETVTKARDIMFIEQFEKQVVRLPARGYGTTEFDMSDEKRAILIQAGKSAVEKYFQKHTAMVLSASNQISSETAQMAQDVALRILGE